MKANNVIYDATFSVLVNIAIRDENDIMSQCSLLPSS